MVAKHFRIAREIPGINCRYGLFFAKISFFISYLLFPLVLAKIKCEAKLVRRGKVSMGDAAEGMDLGTNLLSIFCSPLYQLVQQGLELVLQLEKLLCSCCWIITATGTPSDQTHQIFHWSCVYWLSSATGVSVEIPAISKVWNRISCLILSSLVRSWGSCIRRHRAQRGNTAKQ